MAKKTAVKKNVKATVAVQKKSTAAGKKAPTAVKKAVKSASSSQKTSAAGKAKAKTPAKAVKAPAKAVKIKAPAKAVKAPAKTVKAPAKAVKAPAKTVKAPAKKAPVKAVKAPAKAVKAPAAPVKAMKPASAKKTTSHIRKDEILKKLRLSKADKKFFRDLLLRARSSFGAQVQYYSDDALSRKDSAGERVGMATHMADLGTDNNLRDFQLGLLSDGVDVLEMIDEALQRLEDSEYGICLDCGEPIPRKRLEAKPYAKYCTQCKSKREAMDETYYHRR